MSAQFYRPNAEKVAAELIDGEAIIINVATGNYYNTEGIGGWVWQQCVTGRGLDEIATLAADRFDVDAASVRTDIVQFFQSLEEEELVTGSDAGTDHLDIVTEVVTEKTPYAAPKLVAYRDLKDLLALDPPMPRLGADKPAPTPLPSR